MANLISVSYTHLDVYTRQASDTTETKGTWVARKFTEKKNHVAGVTDTEGNTVSYEWDETTDLLKSLIDGRGNKISYRYDAAQRLSAVSQKVTIGNVQKLSLIHISVRM